MASPAGESSGVYREEEEKVAMVAELEGAMAQVGAPVVAAGVP